jgi:beta-1,2-N-acetylglucosaminyltransferase
MFEQIKGLLYDKKEYPVQLAVDNMMQAPYDAFLFKNIRNAVVLSHSSDPFADNFVPENAGLLIGASGHFIKDRSRVLFFEQTSEHDFDNWLHLAKGWRIWDLDVRGNHKQ